MTRSAEAKVRPGARHLSRLSRCAGTGGTSGSYRQGRRELPATAPAPLLPRPAHQLVKEPVVLAHAASCSSPRRDARSCRRAERPVRAGPPPAGPPKRPGDTAPPRGPQRSACEADTAPPELPDRHCHQSATSCGPDRSRRHAGIASCTAASPLAPRPRPASPGGPSRAARLPTRVGRGSIDALAQHFSGLEVGDVARRNRHRRPRAGVVPDPPAPVVVQREAAEAPDLDAPARGETRRHVLEHRLHREVHVAHREQVEPELHRTPKKSLISSSSWNLRSATGHSDNPRSQMDSLHRTHPRDPRCPHRTTASSSVPVGDLPATPRCHQT